MIHLKTATAEEEGEGLDWCSRWDINGLERRETDALGSFSMVSRFAFSIWCEQIAGNHNVCGPKTTGGGQL
jgi:hypothetical protein